MIFLLNLIQLSNHLQYTNSSYVCFQGNQVWKYKYDRRQGFRLERRFPKTVSRVFPGVDAPVIDSAVVSVDNGDVYFFSGEWANCYLKGIPNGHSSATWCYMANASMWCR